MIIIGVDFHPEFQRIALVDSGTGEFQEKRLAHREEAEKFYRALAGQRVRVGMEASGHARWFERLLAELQVELWIGDAAEIRAKRVRKQKTDRQDAQLILRLIMVDRFPKIWVPKFRKSRPAATAVASAPHGEGAHPDYESTASGGAERRPALQEAAVAGARTAATGSIPTGSVGQPVTARSAGADGSTQPDDRGVERGDRAGSREVSAGVATEDASRSRGPNRAGFCAHHRRAERFDCSKQVASYLGLVPLEDSSGNRRRLGHITKQGSSMMRFLRVEAAQVTVHSVPEWRSKYLHLMMRRGRKTAKVSMARKLAVRLYWMMRQGWDYQQWSKFGSHAGQPGHRHGVQ